MSEKASRKNPPPPQQEVEPVMTEDSVQKAAELQAARDGLYKSLADYRELLKDTTLSGNRSKSQKDGETNVLRNLNAQNGIMETVNVGEGPLALVFTALHSVLAMRDKVNELRYQNSMMYKELKELRASRIEKPAGE